MTWNYRLIRQDSEWGPTYGIHEIYYDDEGQPKGWTKDIIGARGDTRGEARQDYLLMDKAFDEPAFVIVGDELHLEDGGFDHNSDVGV